MNEVTYRAIHSQVWFILEFLLTLLSDRPVGSIHQKTSSAAISINDWSSCGRWLVDDSWEIVLLEPQTKVPKLRLSGGRGGGALPFRHSSLCCRCIKNHPLVEWCDVLVENPSNFNSEPVC